MPETESAPVVLTEAERKSLHPHAGDWLGFYAAVERILADRHAALLAEVAASRETLGRVEGACMKALLLTQEAMGHRSNHWRGIDYADGLDGGIEVTVGLVREAMRSADR